jgi:hypothetical protein
VWLAGPPRVEWQWDEDTMGHGIYMRKSVRHQSLVVEAASNVIPASRAAMPSARSLSRS